MAVVCGARGTTTSAVRCGMGLGSGELCARCARAGRSDSIISDASSAVKAWRRVAQRVHHRVHHRRARRQVASRSCAKTGANRRCASRECMHAPQFAHLSNKRLAGSSESPHKSWSKSMLPKWNKSGCPASLAAKFMRRAAGCLSSLADRVNVQDRAVPSPRRKVDE